MNLSSSLCGIAVGALLLTALMAFTPAPWPPDEALKETPGYGHWRVIETRLSPDGEAATIRLQHPESRHIVAILTYRLVASTVIENSESGRQTP